MTSFLHDDFARSVEVILQEHYTKTADVNTQETQRSFAVAYSGGLDSAALLYLANQYAIKTNIKLFVFHVHHGISPNADDWLIHCQSKCIKLGITFDAKKVNLLTNIDANNNLEETARLKRYQALGDLCRQHKVSLLLTAHHQNDQAETVLLRLLRGSGIKGLSGMATSLYAEKLLGDKNIQLARPLLSITRDALASFVHTNAISHIEDESNLNAHYARNALRQKIMPLMEQHFPGFTQCIVRAAEHIQSAQDSIADITQIDFAACHDGTALIISQLKKLPPKRMANILRHWFELHTLHMPSTARMHEMVTQIARLNTDSTICITHDGHAVRCYCDRLLLVKQKIFTPTTPINFQWHGQAYIDFPTFCGRLFFDVSPVGVDKEWLSSQILRIQTHEAGARIKLQKNRPSKTIKHHFQELKTPSWDRAHLPAISTSDNALLYVAQLGLNHNVCSQTSSAHIALRWVEI